MKKYFIRIAGWFKFRLEVFLQNENQRQANRILSELRLRRQRIQLASQTNCPHVAGSNALSEQKDMAGRTSIIWHGLHTGEQIGFCTNCQKQWFPSDPDYAEWRKKTSFNKLSTGGIRIGGGPAEPFLIRSLDLGPDPINIPLFSAGHKDTETDPWLVNPDGSEDEFYRIDFGIPPTDDEVKEATRAV